MLKMPVLYYCSSVSYSVRFHHFSLGLVPLRFCWVGLLPGRSAIPHWGIVGFGRLRRSSCGGARIRMASSRSTAGADHLCLALGIVILMCCAGQGHSLNINEKPVESPKMVCDLCLDFSAEAQRVLSNQKVLERSFDWMSQTLCHPPTPRLKALCRILLYLYVVDTLQVLDAVFDPELCTEAGLCRPGLTNDITTPARLLDQTSRGDAKTCVLCQDFAKDALSYLGSNATKSKILGTLHVACSRLEGISKQCDLLVDVYAPELIEHVDDLTPAEVCEITHMCTPTRKSDLASDGILRDNCALCQFVVLEVKLKLKDPVTQEKLLEVLLNGCNRVKNHVEECKMIVTEYAPFILENLDTILDGDALCQRIGACRVHKLNAAESVLASVLDGHAHLRIHAL